MLCQKFNLRKDNDQTHSKKVQCNQKYPQHNSRLLAFRPLLSKTVNRSQRIYDNTLKFLPSLFCFFVSPSTLPVAHLAPCSLHQHWQSYSGPKFTGTECVKLLLRSCLNFSSPPTLSIFYAFFSFVPIMLLLFYIIQRSGEELPAASMNPDTARPIYWFLCISTQNMSIPRQLIRRRLSFTA